MIKPVTLFWCETGPLVRYGEDGVLRIDDLNPEQHMRWRLSRWELFGLGLRCLLAAVRM